MRDLLGLCWPSRYRARSKLISFAAYLFGVKDITIREAYLKTIGMVTLLSQPAFWRRKYFLCCTALSSYLTASSANFLWHMYYRRRGVQVMIFDINSNSRHLGNRFFAGNYCFEREPYLGISHFCFCTGFLRTAREKLRSRG